jgi:hypothetical protein
MIPKNSLFPTLYSLLSTLPILADYATPIQLSTLQDDAIDESSGLACSYTFPTRFWTHNDSGGKPRIYLIGQDGKTNAHYDLETENRDWEDICSYRLDGQSFIAIADTGDNNRIHPHVSIHIIKEPTIEPSPSSKLPIHRTLQITYPEGPADCESLAIDTASRKFYLATKVRGLTATVYEIPVDFPHDKVTAKAVAQIPGILLTAMDISPDGSQAILLTYGDATLYTRHPGTTWAQAFKAEPAIVSMPPRAQGEAICFGPDGKSLYLTSETPNQPFWKLPLVQFPPQE